MHARHLAFLREGLLIADRESALLVRDILDTCKRFCGLVERWGGDVLPELLSDEEGDVVGERAKAVDEVNEVSRRLGAELKSTSTQLTPDAPRPCHRPLPPPA